MPAAVRSAQGWAYRAVCCERALRAGQDVVGTAWAAPGGAAWLSDPSKIALCSSSSTTTTATDLASPDATNNGGGGGAGPLPLLLAASTGAPHSLSPFEAELGLSASAAFVVRATSGGGAAAAGGGGGGDQDGGAFVLQVLLRPDTGAAGQFAAVLAIRSAAAAVLADAGLSCDAAAPVLRLDAPPVRRGRALPFSSSSSLMSLLFASCASSPLLCLSSAAVVMVVVGMVENFLHAFAVMVYSICPSSVLMGC